jgi:hypothetical protein
LLTEHAKRIYAEASETQKPSLQQVILEIESINHKSDIFNELPVILRLIKGGKNEYLECFGNRANRG